MVFVYGMFLYFPDIIVFVYGMFLYFSDIIVLILLIVIFVDSCSLFESVIDELDKKNDISISTSSVKFNFVTIKL